MAKQRKQVIRVVFDVLDGANRSMRQNEDIKVTAADPDEAIEWVFAEMQRQLNQPDIRLCRVRICA